MLQARRGQIGWPIKSKLLSVLNTHIKGERQSAATVVSKLSALSHSAIVLPRGSSSSIHKNKRQGIFLPVHPPPLGRGLTDSPPVSFIQFHRQRHRQRRLDRKTATVSSFFWLFPFLFRDPPCVVEAGSRSNSLSSPARSYQKARLHCAFSQPDSLSASLD